MQHLCTDKHGTAFYAMRYSPGSLLPDALPWSDDKYDCVIMSLLGDELTTEYAVSVADEVCRARIDYVGAVGPKGEWLHDIIDQSDVIREIQEGVRDKVLMTTWHNDVNSIGELADLMTCFDGRSKRLATVFLGSSDDYEMCTRTLREELVLCLKRNEEEEES